MNFNEYFKPTKFKIIFLIISISLLFLILNINANDYIGIDNDFAVILYALNAFTVWYISFRTSEQNAEISAVAVKVINPLEPLELLQSAAAFKSRSLYGGRIKRMKMSQVMKQKMKQKTRRVKG